MRNLVVTGGAGFLGSHFVRSLLAGRLPGLGPEVVTVLDKLAYASSFANLAEVAYDKRLDFVPGDAADAPLVDTVLRGASAVLHLAGHDVLATQVLLDAATRYGVRFVQISSDAVYGSLDTGFWPVGAPLAPSSPPAALQAAADLLTLAAHRTHDLPATVARLSTVYGPFQHPGFPLPHAMTALLSGGTAHLGGDEIRDWLHVDDAARALARILVAGRPGAVYHVAGSIELSDHQLAHLLRTELEIDPSRLTPAPPATRDHRRALDDSLLREQLAWRPRVEFTAGLAGTLHWYRTNPSWWRPLLPT